MSPPTRKWAYLLAHIGGPIPMHSARDAEYQSAYESWKNNAQLNSIGIALRPVTIDTNDMFSFTVRGGEADDSLAQRFNDAAVAALTLLYGPSPFDEAPVVLRVPLSLLRSRKLTRGTLVAKQAAMDHQEPFDELSLLFTFGRCVQVPADVLATVWQSLPVTMSDPFYDAVHFYAESVRQFSFEGDDIREVLLHDPALPLSKRDTVRAETAVQSAFKAVEALIGEPPRDERKLRRKLKDIGVHPDDLIGWQWSDLGPPREPILRGIRRLHDARDKRAAHAKTPSRTPLTYYEVMDCQGCARAVLVGALEHQLRSGKGGVAA
jgi:hypothetical protein